MFLILKSEVWARNTDFGAISINFEDEFPRRETWKIEPFVGTGRFGLPKPFMVFFLKKFLTVCWVFLRFFGCAGSSQWCAGASLVVEHSL